MNAKDEFSPNLIHHSLFLIHYYFYLCVPVVSKFFRLLYLCGKINLKT